jgi:hypothetical protein
VPATRADNIGAPTATSRRLRVYGCDVRSLRPILVACLALVALTSHGAPVAARTAKFCSAKRSKTIVRTETVRIYDRKHVRYGCDRRARRKMRLGPSGLGLESPPGHVVSDLQVANYFVAYTLASVPASSQSPYSDTYVRWVDLRHGRRLSPATGCTRRYEESDGNGVWRVLLAYTGVIAWVCSDVAASEVHKLDVSGPGLLGTYPARLDMSLDMGVSTGDVRVYWTDLDGLHTTGLAGFCCDGIATTATERALSPAWR